MTADNIPLLRLQELKTMTFNQSAARGDRLRFKCLDCKRERIVPAQKLAARYGDRVIGELKPRCDDCHTRRRKGWGLHPPGYATYLEILAPGDPGYDDKG